MFLNGREYKKSEIMRLVGDISQIGGIKKYTVNEGKAKGMTAFEVSNGAGIQFTVLPDRGFDISHCNFMGDSLAWISKTGEVAPQFYEKDGDSLMRSFFGGLLSTCGLRNVGASCECDGENFGQHGRISNIPAENVFAHEEWIENDYVLQLGGEMRESAVFGENIVLRRKISLKLGENKIKISDKIINEGFRKEGICLLYHMNFGFPLISETSKLTLPKAKSIMPVGQYSDEDVKNHINLSGAIHDYKEQCYFYDFVDDEVDIKLENPKSVKFRSLVIKYNKKELPCFTTWKQFGEGDYVLGIEPGTTFPMGRSNSQRKGFLIELQPFEEKNFNIELIIE